MGGETKLDEDSDTCKRKTLIIHRTGSEVRRDEENVK